MRIVAILALAAIASAKDFPAWVHDAAKQPAGSYPAKVTAEVLLSEERLSVASDGKRTMNERGAVRILQTSKNAPVARRTYNTKNGRIRDFRAWQLSPSGQETEYDKKKVIDVALDPHGSYDEGRAKMIECDPASPQGTVFAYEVTEEEDTIFTTYHYMFQEDDPVAVSRFVLSLPAGWEARGTILNHAAFEPQVAGTTYTWELRSLPWIEDQEFSPGFHELAPRLGVTYFPSSSANPALVPLKNWTALSAWFAGFSDPSAALSPAISSKAVELLRAANTDMDRIRAIARFVQQTNYVSVQMNVTRGGGYTPHAAADVLSRNYGDCKDKATLMRALLKAAGIDSYAVSLYSGDREFVRPEWPSPMQFNHAIVAVKLPAGVDSAAVVDDPKLGRLLIFDPTDPYSPVGDLPEDEQGSFALIEAPHDGDLVKLPQLPPSANRIELTVEGELSADGQARGRLTSQYFGQSASAWRAAAHEDSKNDVKQALERIFTQRLGSSVALDRIALKDQPEQLELSLDLQAAHLGQLMMNKLLVVKWGAMAPDHGYSLPKTERKQPIRLFSQLRKDRVTLRLPAGFAVDEMPDPMDLKSPYGIYHASWKSADGAVTFEQSLEVQAITAPASDYAKVRAFFDHVTGGHYAPVVLTRR